MPTNFAGSMNMSSIFSDISVVEPNQQDNMDLCVCVCERERVGYFFMDM